jgi:Membrane bound FAD containing D-sorbitol dehydrogenase
MASGEHRACQGEEGPTCPEATITVPASPVHDPVSPSATLHSQGTHFGHSSATSDLYGQPWAGSYMPTRRMLLMTALAASATAALIPPAVAAPAADAGRDAFLATSKILTGRSSLDLEEASRLYDALVADDPQFSADMQALHTLIDQRKIDPLRLQQVLDTEHSTLAALPRKIMTAWYIGVVGQSQNARCLSFETSLVYQTVSDHLKPPSYCYGVYGSWAEKPA